MRKVAGEHSFCVLIYMNSHIFHFYFILFVLLSYLMFDFVCLTYYWPTHMYLPNTHAHPKKYTHTRTQKKGEKGRKSREKKGKKEVEKKKRGGQERKKRERTNIK